MPSKISAILNIIKFISTLFEFIATELRPNMTAIVITLKRQHDAGIITSHNGCQNWKDVQKMIYGWQLIVDDSM